MAKGKLQVIARIGSAIAICEEDMQTRIGRKAEIINSLPITLWDADLQTLSYVVKAMDNVRVATIVRMVK